MPQQRAYEWLQAQPRVCAQAERDSASLSRNVAIRAAAHAYASIAVERAPKLSAPNAAAIPSSLRQFQPQPMRSRRA